LIEFHSIGDCANNKYFFPSKSRYAGKLKISFVKLLIKKELILMEP
jgi:hypothetical protein